MQDIVALASDDVSQYERVYAEGHRKIDFDCYIPVVNLFQKRCFNVARVRFIPPSSTLNFYSAILTMLLISVDGRPTRAICRLINLGFVGIFWGRLPKKCEKPKILHIAESAFIIANPSSFYFMGVRSPISQD